MLREEGHPLLLAFMIVFGLLIVAYSVIIVNNLLLGISLAIVLGIGYLFFVLLRVLGRIAEALERLAAQPEDASLEP